MLQYLLNASAIWLICLLAFDLLLRKETFHAYNRLYLLFSLAVGLLLPLWVWAADSSVYTTALQQPLNTVAETKQGIELAANTTEALSLQEYLAIIYIAGICIAALMLLTDIAKVMRLYLIGKKSKDQGWTLIETGKPHSPFSLFSLLFVNNKDRYEADQWEMILRHEQQHNKRLHFIDLLLIQSVTIIFWFHPLVYIYRKRLMLIHEYEADAAIEAPIKDYGHFLLEQSLLASAPVITHSFNRSPIKNRIFMLTRSSGAYAKTKLLVILPVLLVSTLFFTQRGYSQEKKWDGNKVTFKGNTFEMKVTPPDTIQVQDPVSGEMQYLVTRMEPRPLKMNGQAIHDEDEITRDRAFPTDNSYNNLGEYLTEKQKEEFEKLPDGKYILNVSNIVVNTSGNIVYYDYSGLSANTSIKVPEDLQKRIAQKTQILLDKVDMKPARLNGKAVVCYLSKDDASHNQIIVQDHKVTFKDISKR